MTSGTFAENLALPLHFQAGTGHLLFDDELFPGLSRGYRVTVLHQPQEFKNLRGLDRGNSVPQLGVVEIQPWLLPGLLRSSIELDGQKQNPIVPIPVQSGPIVWANKCCNNTSCFAGSSAYRDWLQSHPITFHHHQWGITPDTFHNIKAFGEL